MYLSGLREAAAATEAARAVAERAAAKTSPSAATPNGWGGGSQGSEAAEGVPVNMSRMEVLRKEQARLRFEYERMEAKLLEMEAELLEKERLERGNGRGSAAMSSMTAAPDGFGLDPDATMGGIPPVQALVEEDGSLVFNFENDLPPWASRWVHARNHTHTVDGTGSCWE